MIPAAKGRVVRGALELVIIPTLAATVAVKIDLVEHFRLWLVVVFLLLSGDARWLGAFTGAAVLGGRRSLAEAGAVVPQIQGGFRNLINSITRHVLINIINLTINHNY